MIPIISLPAKIVKLLESNVSPAEIAAGVCLGMFLGFIPLNGPMAVFLVIFFLVVKLNRLSTVLTLPVFKLFYVLGVSRLTDALGGYLLIGAEYLTYFWRLVTNLPIIAYLDLNNTLVAGGMCLSIILCLPVYLVSVRAAALIKEKYADKIQNLKFVQWVKKIPVVSKVSQAIGKLRSQA